MLRYTAVPPSRNLLTIVALTVFLTGGQLVQPLAAQEEPSEQEPAGEMTQEEVDPLESLDWTAGPATGEIGEKAEIALPEGYRIVGREGTRAILEACGNVCDGTELALLAPAKGIDWFVVFEFDECGYVKDDEEIDADALLESLKEGTRSGNEARRERGFSEMEVIGWTRRPAYDPTNHNLEWGIKYRSEGVEGINFNTRILGRKGVMSANLVVDLEDLEATLPTFKSLMRGYAFTSGNKYGEYRKGDKLAEYGLGALVAGGALAVAAKTGLLAKFWKVLLVIPLAIAAFFRKLFGRRKPAPARARHRPFPSSDDQAAR